MARGDHASLAPSPGDPSGAVCYSISPSEGLTYQEQRSERPEL